MMELDERLTTIAGYVTGKRAADIGCDHGKLAVYLLENGLVEQVYATDISPDSLDKVRKISLPGLVPLLGDGFQPLCGLTIDTAVLCGIGSNLTCQLLERDREIVCGIPRLVLSPLKNVYLVREYLYHHGFNMVDEDLVRKDGRFYPVFVAERGEWAGFDDVDMFVGRRLMEKRHPLLLPWLQKRIGEMEENIRQCQEGKKRDCTAELAHMKRMLEAYRKGEKQCIPSKILSR